MQEVCLAIVQQLGILRPHFPRASSASMLRGQNKDNIVLVVHRLTTQVTTQGTARNRQGGVERRKSRGSHSFFFVYGSLGVPGATLGQSNDFVRIALTTDQGFTTLVDEEWNRVSTSLRLLSVRISDDHKSMFLTTWFFTIRARRAEFVTVIQAVGSGWLTKTLEAIFQGQT